MAIATVHSLHKTGRRARQSVAAFFHSPIPDAEVGSEQKETPDQKMLRCNSALVSRGGFSIWICSSLLIWFVLTPMLSSLSIAPRAAAVVDALLCLSFSIIAFLGLWLPVGDGQGSVWTTAGLLMIGGSIIALIVVYVVRTIGGTVFSGVVTLNLSGLGLMRLRHLCAGACDVSRNAWWAIF